MGLIDELGDGPIGVDTAVFIYFIQEHRDYLPLIEPIFRRADEGARELVTSALTLLEVLVVPYRAADRSLADRFEALLTRSRGIRMIDVGRDQLRMAAQLRGATGVRTPDALQLVAGLSAGCKTFLTNDGRLPRIPGMRVLQLASYV